MTVRLATEADVDALTALRRAWVEEDAGPIDDGGAYEREFAVWFAAESGRRLTWIATVDGSGGPSAWTDGRRDTPVGMLNLVEFHRMPRPDRLYSRWGYISNVFVLAQHRNSGIGRQLLDAALASARERGYARLVLSPSDRARPLYQRVGFARADELMLLPLP